MELGANRFELLRRRLYRRVERSAQVCPGLFRGCSAGPMRSGLLLRAISRAFLRGSLALFRGSPAFISSSSAFISSSPALIQFGAARRAAAVRVLVHAKYRSIYNIAKIRLLGEEPAFCKSQKRWPAIRRVAKGLANTALQESNDSRFWSRTSCRTVHRRGCRSCTSRTASLSIPIVHRAAPSRPSDRRCRSPR